MRFDDRDVKFALVDKRVMPTGACQMTISATISADIGGKTAPVTVSRQVNCECKGASKGKCADACYHRQLNLQWPNGKQLRGMLAEDLDQAIRTKQDQAAAKK